MQSLTISEAAQSEWWDLERVKQETSFSRSTIYRLMDSGEFPQNHAVRSVNRKVWFEAEVRAWKAGQITQEVVGADPLGDLL